MFRRPFNPPNRFDPQTIEWEEAPPAQKLRLIEDKSRKILTKNHSPDIGFDWSVNPYRGCTHACTYCYARPYHEYLGYSAGTDFERIILYKSSAARLLRVGFEHPKWAGEPVAFSGITDCYQHIERKLGITRGCLEVCVAYRNPVIIITRSPLITRDLDLLVELAQHNAIRVHISIPLVDNSVARVLEPGAPPPSARLRTIRALADATIPVGISLSPIIPGLSDEHIPRTLQLAKEAGAQWAWGGLLRLPGAVAQVFEHRLRQAFPHQADRVMRRLRDARGGYLNSSQFGQRLTGQGNQWDITHQLLEQSKRRLGFANRRPFPGTPFRRPGASKQLALF